MFSNRSQIAELWCRCARLRRTDIFGPADPLRPSYARPGNLAWQVGVAAVGMVGANYKSGGLAFLSINPAGGSEHFRTNQLSERMYQGFKGLQNPTEPGGELTAFEEMNAAVLPSMPYWASMGKNLEKIREAMKWRYEDIAYLYVVPFRTKGDKGSAMAGSQRGRSYIEQGYEKHLKGQLALLSPGKIIAMDRPSNEIAERYRDEEVPELDVVYFTRKPDAHAERDKILQQLTKGSA